MECAMNGFDFHLPVRVRFGRGRLAGLGDELDRKFERIFIVTDETMAFRTPALAAVESALSGRATRVFLRVEENPAIETVEAAAREAAAFDPQLVVGLGGGSPLDAAKGVALLLRNPGPLRRYLAGAQPENAPLPLVAIPTTSGTGSEVTPYAVFTDREAGSKIGYAHPGFYPLLACLDPALTDSMPPAVVLNTGLDALAHALEAFLSTIATPLSDGFALPAAEIALASLPRAVAKEPEAMDRMAYASMLAGAAIAQASTILPHILGYPLTVFHGVAHGRASAVMLVHVLAELRKSPAAADKVRRVDALLAAHDGLEGFLRGLGVSARLSEYGVRVEEVPLFAQKTIIKGDVKITPMPVTTESLEALVRGAL
jgi:alcohol dehydrogenase class IV